MAVAFDAKTSAVTNLSSGTSITINTLAVGSGSNRAMAVEIVWGANSTVPSGVTAVWDSGGTNQAMTLVTGTNAGSSAATAASSIYALLAPTSGTKNLVISWTGSNEAHAAAVSFTGVDQTSVAVAFPHGTTNFKVGATASPCSVTVTSATGNMVVNGFFQKIGGWGTISGTTIATDGVTGPNQGVAFSYASGAATVTSTAAFSGSDEWGAFGCDILAAGGGGGTAYTLTATSGAAALGGQVNKLAYGRKLTAAAGSFALSGKAAGFAYGHRLVAAAGSVTLTSFPATLRYGAGYILPCMKGVFALNGVAARLAYARDIVVTSGTFALSGQSATLRYARAMPLLAGAFTLNGVAATLRTARKVAAVQATFTLNGQAANFRYTRAMPAGVGAFSLSSTATNLIYSGSGAKVLPAMRGQFVLNGQAAGSRLTRVLALAPGSIVFGGQAAGLRRDLKLFAVNGPFALTGNVAGLVYQTAHARVMAASPGSFVLEGVAANLIAMQLEKQPGPIEFGRPVWLRAW